MFVGCVVAGAVVLASGGAKARGALLRDVAGYLLAVGAAAGVLASGRGTAGRAVALLALYAAFVAVVLGADMWRIARERMRCALGLVLCALERRRPPLTSSGCHCCTPGLLRWGLDADLRAYATPRAKSVVFILLLNISVRAACWRRSSHGESEYAHCHDSVQAHVCTTCAL